MKLPRLRLSFLAAMALAACLSPNLAAAVEPKILHFAFQGDLKSVDPYTLNESFSLSVLGRLRRADQRDTDLKIVPGLAEAGKCLDPLHWRFHLRKGVKFHDGEAFTADDVVFSATRARRRLGPQGAHPADAKVVKVDDYTVDFVLTTPNPLLLYEWETWDIFSKSWAEAHGATKRPRCTRHPALCRRCTPTAPARSC